MHTYSVFFHCHPHPSFFHPRHPPTDFKPHHLCEWPLYRCQPPRPFVQPTGAACCHYTRLQELFHRPPGPPAYPHRPTGFDPSARCPGPLCASSRSTGALIIPSSFPVISLASHQYSMFPAIRPYPNIYILYDYAHLSSPATIFLHAFLPSTTMCDCCACGAARGSLDTSTLLMLGRAIMEAFK